MQFNKIKDVLLRARSRLAEERRWIQNAVTGLNDYGETTYCLVGACTYENNLSDLEQSDLFDSLWAAIRDCGFRYDGVSAFNDSPLRKHQTVLRVLDHAIQSF